jgi:hypothetical protein
MRKLLHTTAALSALLVTSMAANAADFVLWNRIGAPS